MVKALFSILVFIILSNLPVQAQNIRLMIIQSEPISLSDNRPSQTVEIGLEDLNADLTGKATIEIGLSQIAKEFVLVSPEIIELNVTSGIIESPKSVTFSVIQKSSKAKRLPFSYIVKVELNGNTAEAPPFRGKPIFLAASKEVKKTGSKLPICPEESVFRNVRFENNGSVPASIVVDSFLLSCPNLDASFLSPLPLTITLLDVPGNLSLPLGIYTFCTEWVSGTEIVNGLPVGKYFHEITNPIILDSADIEPSPDIIHSVIPGILTKKTKKGPCGKDNEGNDLDGHWTGTATTTSGDCTNAEIMLDIENGNIRGEAIDDDGTTLDIKAKIDEFGNIKRGGFALTGKNIFTFSGHLDAASGIGSGNFKSKTLNCAGEFEIRKSQ
jgi:hypothetical protein